MSIIKGTRANLQREVFQSNKPVLVDFWAPWCGPCRMVAPVLEEIAREHPEIQVVKINIDEEPQLAAQFGIMSIPTLWVVQGGKVIKQTVGVRPKAAILSMLP